MFFFFSSSAAHRDIHSFPTRRSSDLRGAGGLMEISVGRYGSLFDGQRRTLSHVPTYGCLRYAATEDRFSLWEDRKSTRLNSSHVRISYAVFCLKKKKNNKYCLHDYIF